MMLIRSDIKKRLVTFINEYFIKETGLVVNDDASLIYEGILDSTGVIELVCFMESDFEIRIEDEEIIPDNFDSINKLVDFIYTKSKEQL